MNRPETTKWLSKLLEEHIDPKNDPRVYWAKEITFDYGSVSPIRVDYMQFKPLPSTTPVPFSAPDMPQMEIGDDDLPF